MTARTIETSPQLYARIGGVLYLIIIVIGLFGEAFVRDRLIVSGDAAATAANIMSHESLWRFHIAAELFLLICAVALLLILFVLLKPVSRDLALLAAFFNLVAIIIEAATTMRLLEALFPLGNDSTDNNEGERIERTRGLDGTVRARSLLGWSGIRKWRTRTAC